MSIWTHVAVTIRFDALRISDHFSMTVDDLGQTCTFDSDRDAWDQCNVPCGSEGSLQTHLWVNPQMNCMAAYTAAIHGDLRDYQDVEEIKAYLNRICKGRLVRQGVANIEVEDRVSVVLKCSYMGHWEVVKETTDIMTP